MSKRTWILGASDPEMTLIEGLLAAAGEAFCYASVQGVRVHPGNAYKADGVLRPPPGPDGLSIAEVEAGLVEVECALAHASSTRVVRIDHHRPGDPGFGRPPAEFLAASSVGQVLAILAATVPTIAPDWPAISSSAPSGVFTMSSATIGFEGLAPFVPSWDLTWGAALVRVPAALVLAAAADHCLAAAYRGECPGVEPDALAAWRLASRAAFQRRPASELLADFARARVALSEAPLLDLATALPWKVADEGGYCQGCGGSEAVVRDMRGPVVPELPEAAMRLGIAYIAGPLKDRDGREKITVSGPPATVEAFLRHWAPAQGLIDMYPSGPPAQAAARGFAGGYLAAKAAAVESPVPHSSPVSDSEFYLLVQHEAPGGWTERSSAFRCEECARRWAGLHAQGPGGWHVESRPLSEAPRFPDLFTDWEGRYPSPLCERRP